MVAVDGSPPSLKAFEYAMLLAKDNDAELAIVHAIPETRMGGLVEYGTKYGSMAIVHAYVNSAEKGALVWLKPLEIRARQNGVKVKAELVWELGKPPVQLITEYAKKNSIDLIVLGSRGIGGLKRLLLGSVASGVVNHASCAVLVVR